MGGFASAGDRPIPMGSSQAVKKHESVPPRSGHRLHMEGLFRVVTWRGSAGSSRCLTHRRQPGLVANEFLGVDITDVDP